MWEDTKRITFKDETHCYVSIATVVTRTRHNFTLLAPCLSCFYVKLKHSRQNSVRENSYLRRSVFGFEET